MTKNMYGINNKSNGVVRMYVTTISNLQQLYFICSMSLVGNRMINPSRFTSQRSKNFNLQAHILQIKREIQYAKVNWNTNLKGRCETKL